MQRHQHGGHRTGFLGRTLARRAQRAARVSGRECASRSSPSSACALHEEEDGKLFPDSNKARDVLDALLGALRDAGAELHTGERVTAVTARERRISSSTAAADAYRASAVVLATGGRSLPKTGSDGAGYAFARALGHGYVETTPALAPLVLNGERHAALAGVSHRVRLTFAASDGRRDRSRGRVAVDAFRRQRAGRAQRLASLAPGAARRTSRRRAAEPLSRGAFESLEAWLLEQAVERPRAQIATVLAARLPAAVADAWVDATGSRRT